MDINSILQGFSCSYERYSSVKIKDKVWHISSNNGDYCLKESKIPRKRVEFIYNSLKILADNGFSKFPGYIMAKDGQPYVMLGQKIYTLNNWIDGTVCEMSNNDNLRKACLALGEFHSSSNGISDIDGADGRVNYQSHLGRYRSRLEDLYKYEGLLDGNFHQELCSHYPVVIRMAEKAVELLESSKYLELSQKYSDEGKFIHNDIAGRNFIIKDDGAYLIDFDYLSLDLPHIDLVRLISRTMKHSGDYRASLMVIITSYMDRYSLNYDDFFLVYCILLFPQKIWRVANRHYDEFPDGNDDKILIALNEAVDSIYKKTSWLSIYCDIIGLEDRYENCGY